MSTESPWVLAEPGEIPIKDIPLNPGIAKTVAWLQARGFNTTSSGDGDTHSCKCDQEQPYVTIESAPAMMVETADRLASLLLSEHGIEVQQMNESNTLPCVDCHYQPGSEGLIMLWNVKLTT